MTRQLVAPDGIGKTISLLKKLGVVILVIGLLGLAYPYLRDASAISIGAFMVLGGHFRMTFAIASRSLGPVALKYFFGLTMIFSGTGFIGNPSMTSEMMTLAMTFYLAADVITSSLYGYALMKIGGGRVLLINTFVTAILAVMTYIEWPTSGNHFLGFVIGLKLLLDGFALLWLGNQLKKAYS